MQNSKPSLAARALVKLVDTWPIYQHGETLSRVLGIAGFNDINCGNFSSVVEGMPGQVIKVFSLNDIGYQQLITYAIRNPNEHLPTLFSFTKSGKYGIIELERLEHRPKEAVKISEYIDRCRAGRARKHQWGDPFQKIILNLDQYVNNYNAVNSDHLSWDCHEGNIMFRGSVPVLVDILYGEV